jgi:small subunit ribosomal protein S8
MITDRVGDFITRLNNAARAGKVEVSVPHSDHLEAIARKLKELGFLAEIQKTEDTKKTLIVSLAYSEQGTPRIRGVKRMSSPGRRSYLSHKDAHRVKGGMGARLVSTPKGVLSDAEARKVRIGGEDLFQIW